MTGARSHRPWRVFLSHTTELAHLPVGRSFVSAATTAVRKAGHAVVDMGDFTASPNPPPSVCQARVIDADVYVGIIGFRWGSSVDDDPERPPGEPRRSYTELEFDTATARGKPRLIFLLADDTHGTRELLVDPTYGGRQESFRDRLSRSGITRAMVSTPAELETALLHALHDLATHRTAVRSLRLPSAYLRQVERIAPPALLGRDNEVAELADFCLNPTAEQGWGQYAWWRAPAWSGKSALMSSFVLRPPERIRNRITIVSFFITARLAAQDTRSAFTTVLTQQLAGLLEVDLPPSLDDATREAHLLELLHQAAERCEVKEKRLVLIVDGLDEDRGITSGTGAHSIAALLPVRPPADMRIIVAGRPNPPIPDDVDSWHPLRDPRIIRVLQPSDYAQRLRQRSEQELRRLLGGTTMEQDLLGLLAAARGGLSCPDAMKERGLRSS